MQSQIDEQDEVYAFSLDVLEPLSESDLRSAISEATREALAELQLDPTFADTDIEGGFGGLGEVAVILVIKKVGAIVATAALAGAGKKAGEIFIEKYVVPRLRSRNLLPKGLRRVSHPKGKNEE